MAAESDKKNKGGRPRIPIDKDVFVYLLSCGCTLKMIAGYFALQTGSCSEDTIERFCSRTYGKTFAELRDLYREGGKSRILQKQMEVALAGSEKMLIHLGKVFVGQKENATIDTEQRVSKLYEVLDKESDEDEEE